MTDDDSVSSDDDQLKYTLSISFLGFCCLITVFIVLRNFQYFDHVYKPNHLFSNKIQPPRNLLALVSFIWSLTDETIIESCGIDGLCFLRILWDCFKLNCIIFPFGMILMGLYVEGSEPDEDYTGNLPRMTIGALPNGSSYFWGSWVMVYVMTFVFVYFLQKTYKELAVYAEKQHLRSDQASHTIMIGNLPRRYQNDDALYELMDTLFPDKVIKVKIARRLDSMMKQFDIFEKLKVTKMINMALGKGNTSLDDDLITSKNTLQKMATTHENLESCGVGFVTFKTIQAAIEALSCNALFKADEPFEEITMAPTVENVIWENLHVTKTEQTVLKLVYRLGYFGLILFYTPFIVAIQGVVNLDNIPGGRDWAKDNPQSASFIQGFLPVLLVRVFFFTLPYTLRWLARQSRPFSRVTIDKLTVQSYSDCLIGMGLLLSFISTIFLGSFKEIFEEAFDFNKLRDTLATNIPKFSTFNMNFVIFATFFGLAAEISQVFVIMFDVFGWRDHYEMYWFYYWPASIYIFVLVAAYAVISPLIIIFGAIYFFLAYFIFAYQLIFVYKARNLEGKLFTTIYGRLHAGVIVGQACLISQFALKENFVQAGLLLPAIWITQYSIKRYKKSFGVYFNNPSIRAAAEFDAEAIQDWIGKESIYQHALLSEEAIKSGFENDSISMQDIEEAVRRENEERIDYPLMQSNAIQHSEPVSKPKANSGASLKDVNI